MASKEKPPPEEKPLAERIREAAEREGMNIEAFRRAKKLPNTSFYGLLRNELPAKVATREEWRRRLTKAGVEVNGSL